MGGRPRGAKAAVVVAVIVWAVVIVWVMATAPGARADTPRVPAPAPIALKSDPNQTGVRYSAYEGKYFRAVDDPYRQCIAEREGHGQYWGTGSNGAYESTYQMTDALVRGQAWNMTAELKVMFPERWRLIRNTLLDTPGHLWARFYMDMAWWTALNLRGDRSGAFHWAGGRWTCTPGMRWSR